jgi:aspartate-semialdehyde dehydrogenase
MRVAVAGATGAVGREMLRTLQARRFPVDELVPLASSRSEGTGLRFGGQDVEVRRLDAESFEDVDLALFSAGATASREHAPRAAEAGCIVVDNSSAFRMDPDVPLLIPEINPEAVQAHRGIIANPNCTAITALMAVAPLHLAAGLRSLVVSSYQSVSGAGERGVRELLEQMEKLRGQEDDLREPEADALPAGEVFGLTDLPVAATVVRVPVLVGHAVSIHAEFDRQIAPGEARLVMADFPGVRVFDDPSSDLFPTPLDAAGIDEVLVGRVRRAGDRADALLLWAVGDNLRKGAALNAVQIAELVTRR